MPQETAKQLLDFLIALPYGVSEGDVTQARKKERNATPKTKQQLYFQESLVGKRDQLY